MKLPMPDTQTTSSHWSDRGSRSIPKIDITSTRQGNAPATPITLLRLTLLGRPFIGVAIVVGVLVTGWWPATPIALWFHYGSTASAIHHLIHASLGLRPRTRDRWLTALGLLIAESGHAWQSTHVLHHRDGTDLPDPEGYIETLSWRQLPWGALQWRFRMQAWGWRHGRRRSLIRREVTAIALTTALAVGLAPITFLPAAYIALMQLGTLLFAVVLAKGPQNRFGLATTPLTMVHSRLFAVVMFNHHMHLEHHAYPKVPLAHLAQLRPQVEDALTHETIDHVRFV